MVDVASFTFRFQSLQQLCEYLDYFSKRTHPSSRRPIPENPDSWDHYDNQTPFEKLPMYLFEEPKRQKVIKALAKAKELWECGKL
jgi:hypothetical protein